VAAIGGESLDRRVPVPGSGDEIARLAQTMNGMLERLERSSERQRRFVADASHELRGPLTRIRTELEVDLAHLPQDDPKVYAMLQAADTVGLFQVESRAQMATLPRMKPDHFYDLVVEVAIIRPGPIVGKMVHPYLNRRAGREEVTYPHPSLEPILKRTLGVPLFQEQLLRMAMVAAGFSGTEAEELRRAFGFKRSERRMVEIEAKLRAGMARQGIVGHAADEIVRAITAFALYGFPESHASSFALLAYASAWLKVRQPAPFYAALLNNQPMGFYHPATIVKDALRARGKAAAAERVPVATAIGLPRRPRRFAGTVPVIEIFPARPTLTFTAPVNSISAASFIMSAIVAALGTSGIIPSALAFVNSFCNAGRSRAIRSRGV